MRPAATASAAPTALAARAPGLAGARPIAVFNLLSLGRLYLQPGEVVPMLTHRHMLSLYLILFFALVALDFNGASPGLPVELRGTIYIFAMGTALCLLGLSLSAALTLAERRNGRVALHLSPVLILATLGSVLVGESCFRLLLPVEDPSALRLFLIVAFHYIVAEFAAAAVAHGLLPTILAELRSQPITQLSETDPALWAPDPDPGLADLAPEELGFLIVGDRSIPLPGLLHLQAEGNYVHLWAQDRHELLPGPLADLVRQMPTDSGRLVHRSHWVATAAIRRWHSDGREITLQLSNDQSVPVAVTRRREVRDWLLKLDIPRMTGPR